MAARTLMTLVALVALLPYAISQGPQGQNTTTPLVPPEPPEEKCELVTDVPICKDMPWNYTLFPNLRGHENQIEASEELEQFRKLIEVNCSGAIVHFLCSIYTPFCTDDHPLRVLRPCKRLCEHVRSGCEQIFVSRTGGLPWPNHLNCENYDNSDLCFGPDMDGVDDLTIPTDLVAPSTPTITDPAGTTDPPSTTDEPTQSPSTPASPMTTSTRCPSQLWVTSNVRNKSFSFAGIENCGPDCGGIYFSESQRNIVAPLFILIFSLVCIVFTAFTVATFFINRNRFHYPERPIVYLSFCYLLLSVAYFIGSISKLVGGGDASFACTESHPRSDREIGLATGSLPSRYVFQNLPNDNVNMSTACCVFLFLLSYYTQMAAGLWWVILTFTWFLAAVLKWGEEAVAKLWPLYHVITWSIPALQTILILALQFVDGDQLSGLCYPGQFSRVALGVFVYMPLLIYLILGSIFLVIGFSALVNIRRELERDPVKARKLGRLIIRIGVYSALYIIPNSIILFIHTYELAERERWETSYIDNPEACFEDGQSPNCPNSPDFAAFLIRYISLFCVGIFSTSWVFSKKTLNTWTKFFQSCGCGQGKGFDSKQAYDLPEKDPRRLQTAV